MRMNQWRDEIHKNAKVKGWWKDERSFGEIIALCHSELSEALEEFRNGRKHIWYNCNGCIQEGNCLKTIKEGERCAKPEGIPIELADCIIRILDYCGKEGIDIEEAVRIKHEYNRKRPYRHGNKKI